MELISSEHSYFLCLVCCIMCEFRTAPPNPEETDGIYSTAGKIRVRLEDVCILVPVTLCIMHTTRQFLSSVPAVKYLPHNLQRQIL